MADKKNGEGFADVRGEDASAESDEAHFEDASSGLQDDPAGVGRNPIPPIPSTPTTDEAAPLAAPMAAPLAAPLVAPLAAPLAALLDAPLAAPLSADATTDRGDDDRAAREHESAPPSPTTPGQQDAASGSSDCVPVTTAMALVTTVPLPEAVPPGAPGATPPGAAAPAVASMDSVADTPSAVEGKAPMTGGGEGPQLADAQGCTAENAHRLPHLTDPLRTTHEPATTPAATLPLDVATLAPASVPPGVTTRAAEKALFAGMRPNVTATGGGVGGGAAEPATPVKAHSKKTKWHRCERCDKHDYEIDPTNASLLDHQCKACGGDIRIINSTAGSSGGASEAMTPGRRCKICEQHNVLRNEKFADSPANLCKSCGTDIIEGDSSVHRPAATSSTIGRCGLCTKNNVPYNSDFISMGAKFCKSCGDSVNRTPPQEFSKSSGARNASTMDSSRTRHTLT